MKVFVAITGASGAAYARRTLSALLDAGVEVSLCVSPPGAMVLQRELDLAWNADRPGPGALVPGGEAIHCHRHEDLSAPFASGSADWHGMIVVPCSMGTLGRIAAGISDDLVSRAADVCLKERRPLVLVPRETPLNLIHLENMKRLCQAGAAILPACPAFYHRPESIEELIDTVVARALDHLGVRHRLGERWGE